ncbi:uncharacterized protein LOC106865776 [Brachypodium distachyon]|uniref:Uncharacterized protein n=1 Tax=Brachypodium distachyon TaxID=15368 RepID=A0A2K2DKZ2_BRADI|nr:uncharacterized protein LOC106865776 [Brachypodium distachyon]PNT74944.1 hypothetical protein BRADI_1g24775v3 [Brachypodium distachyon]|eukprot:XP_014752059.1 uncharacterized protein LOC106865776 [Brachypodium distachyon]
MAGADESFPNGDESSGGWRNGETHMASGEADSWFPMANPEDFDIFGSSVCNGDSQRNFVEGVVDDPVDELSKEPDGGSGLCGEGGKSADTRLKVLILQQLCLMVGLKKCA